jgi:shikimate dehydrogenase
MESKREALYFIGVSTSGSSIMNLFPVWAAKLRLEAHIVGCDLPLRTKSDDYRALVQEIAGDERVRGALVTAHKVDVYRAAEDLFAEIDALGQLCREISCISKREGRLIGHAKDPITAGVAMDHMLGENYWTESDAGVLCLGAGGAGTAISVHLLARSQPPRPLVISDRDQVRIQELKQIHGRLNGATDVAYRVVAAPGDNDALVETVPPGSLIINATGMGKDVPGSPISDGATFPPRAVVWDLNYRGDLTFLHQARRQAAQRDLRVHDGWRYFLHGWSEVIAEVFKLDMTPQRFEQLAETAAALRPTAPS